MIPVIRDHRNKMNLWSIETFPMKTNIHLPSLFVLLMIAISCTKPTHEASNTEEIVQAGQSAVHDDESQKNIVQTAVASPSHTTLVAALKAAEYVDALSNAGPFTVFAPTNEAFDKLPKGTLED